MMCSGLVQKKSRSSGGVITLNPTWFSRQNRNNAHPYYYICVGRADWHAHARSHELCVRFRSHYIPFNLQRRPPPVAPRCCARAIVTLGHVHAQTHIQPRTTEMFHTAPEWNKCEQFVYTNTRVYHTTWYSIKQMNIIHYNDPHHPPFPPTYSHTTQHTHRFAIVYPAHFWHLLLRAWSKILENVRFNLGANLKHYTILLPRNVHDN